jgi:hypothetical protein
MTPKEILHAPRLQLTVTQVVASVLAAVTATVAASFLGVSGTVIGAAVASLLTVVGNAVYAHSLHRTKARVSTVTGPVLWRRIALTATGLFAVVLAVMTGVELVSGRPVSDLVRGTAGAGTTVFGSSQRAAGADTGTPAPQMTITRTVVPKVVITTPTVTRTAPVVTVTPTPTPTDVPTSGATSPSASPSPVGS